MSKPLNSNPSSIFSGGSESPIMMQPYGDTSTSTLRSADTSKTTRSNNEPEHSTKSAPTTPQHTAMSAIRSLIRSTANSPRKDQAAGVVHDRPKQLTQASQKGAGLSGVEPEQTVNDPLDEIRHMIKHLIEGNNRIAAAQARQAETVDGLFAEMRAISGAIMALRQEVNILKESSARFPSARPRSQIRAVHKYDP
uniref:Putative capsid protein n=1 Tax=Atrato Chu-like virus 1 TaxID=2689322 RepID=A0A6B9KLU0_9VIRU|nr:putative capsid protein [Atrato Chu-like virus 1]